MKSYMINLFRSYFTNVLIAVYFADELKELPLPEIECVPNSDTSSERKSDVSRYLFIFFVVCLSQKKKINKQNRSISGGASQPYGLRVRID